MRFLDNVIDVSNYPLEPQRQEAMAKRRIGLGVTGLADALIFCGVKLRHARRRRSSPASWMAPSRTPPIWRAPSSPPRRAPSRCTMRERFLASPNVAALDAPVREAIRRHGIRNGCLTSIAPTGTISLLAGNVSSGIEPVFDFVYRRRVLDRERQRRTRRWSRTTRTRSSAASSAPAAALPDSFVRGRRPLPGRAPRHAGGHAAATSTAPSPRPSTARRTSPSRPSRTCTSRRTRSGLKGCTTYRPNPVTGAVLQPVAEPATRTAAAKAAPRPRPAAVDRVAPAAGERAGVVYMAPPLEREGVLSGYTYKLKWPGSDHAIYVTINDIERRRDGGGPFEIFINTRNLEHYAWTVALTRMISAVFRRGGDVTFVAEELKAVFDPQGGHWVAGRYVPSLLAAIGEVIETHMIRTGFLQSAKPQLPLGEAQRAGRRSRAIGRPHGARAPRRVSSFARAARRPTTCSAKAAGCATRAVSRAAAERLCAISLSAIASVSRRSFQRLRVALTAQHAARLRSLCRKNTEMEPYFGSKPGASLSNGT